MDKEYKDMEIKCLGKRTHTGADVEILIDDENALNKLYVSELIWEIGPVDWNDGYGRITIKRYEDKEDIIINNQIKNITLEFKALTIKSDNTSSGTSFYWDDEEVTKKLTPTRIKWTAGNAGTINDLFIKMC